MPSSIPTKTLCLVLTTVVVSLAAPTGATAGAYLVRNCTAAPGSFSTQAFGTFATRGMKIRRACAREGAGRRGLLVTNVLRRGRVGYRARSILTMYAPKGAHFRNYEWSGRIRRRDCGYALQVYAAGPGVPRYDIKNRRAFRRCPKPSLAQKSADPRPRNYRIGNDNAGPNLIVHRIDCRSRKGCSSRGENFVQTFKSSAEVVDYSPPQVQITGGGLASGQWVSGVQKVEYSAVDNVGVSQGKAVLGGVEERPASRSCDYTRLVPCTNGPATLEVDTKRFLDGSQPLLVDAVDSASNQGRSQPVTARVDNAPPPRVDVAVEAGEGWRRTPDFALLWSNPPEGDRAPIAAAHHVLCKAGTSDCTPGRTPGDGISRLDLKAPAPGEHTVSAWREDAAGNQEGDNGSVPVTLRYDPEPPQPVFEPLSPADPTRVSAQVTDKVSGLAGGAIELAPRGTGSWQTLPTGQEGDRLVTRIDDSRFAPGEYELRVRAFDQARNEGSTDRRADGAPMVIRLPLRVTSQMRAGVVGKKTVRRKIRRRGRGRGRGRGRTVHRRITVLRDKRRVRFNRRIAIGGRLTNGDGQGIGGAQLQVFSRTPTEPERLAGMVTTDRNGRYRYTLRASSSRTLRFAYSGTPLVLPAQKEVSLLVRAASSIRVRPRRVRNGQAVSFTGRLGAPAPGKLVELQVRLSGRFQTFRTTRTGPKGRWRVGYRFRRTCGRTRFEFRARLPREGGYPFETGRSHTLGVGVRGRPCAG